jgi:alkanesulfonate monooxygenase SsuD/methylene tetrahydromethanopterin reductase-like flavin-dependent oxidoreductase (luciferase family)
MSRSAGNGRPMDLGVHLPLMQFGSDELSFTRIAETVDAAREYGFAAVSANDHFVFRTPWLDGPTALASVIERTGAMSVATTVSLAVLRGPVPLAKALTALDILSEGRLVAAVGPGSSKRDYDALGVPFDERWKRFDEAVAVLRKLLMGESDPAPAGYYRAPSDLQLVPPPRREGGIPLWIGSWGSKVGIRRVARAGDGWLASAYNTTPDKFSETRGRLARELASCGRQAAEFPNGLATMWTWVTEDRAETDRVLDQILAPLLSRDRDELREQLCVGSAEHCAALLSRYADAGCQRVYVWPLGDEPRQIEVLASEVVPRIGRG